MDAIANLFTRPHVRWIALAVGLVILGAAVGYFLLPSGRNIATGPGGKVAQHGIIEIVEAVNAAAAAETGDLCNRALTRAQSYGVVPDSAKLSGTESPAESEGHFTCQARSATGGVFTLAIEQTCDDLARQDCLALTRVTASDGATLFERQM